MAKYIISGYGGIAKALTERLIRQDHDVSIISRRDNPHIPAKCKAFKLNLSTNCKEMLSDIFSEIKPDYIINTTGLLYDKVHMPEKHIQQVTEEWLFASIQANTLPTLQIAQVLSSIIGNQYRCGFLSFSARVSSIQDNRLGGWYSYRMSKSMLNMLIKNISIEWRRQSPDSFICGYHPGTVDTNLSKPFQKNVPADQLKTANTAAENCLSILESLTPQQTGSLIDWQGEIIEP
jgi:NAD(P)-dependent dehydrogenase (short-subunit alcohol dehydrogenase family)